MIPALAFALQHLGLISAIVREGITIGPEIVNLINDGYEISKKISDENRVPTAQEWADLNALEEYWRAKLHSDDDLPA